jgi:hypothetical protein
MGLTVKELYSAFPSNLDYSTFSEHILLEKPTGVTGVYDAFNINSWLKQGAPDASNQSLLNLVSGGATLTMGVTPGAVDGADPGWDAAKGFTFLTSGIRMQGGSNYSFTTQGFLQILHLNLDASAASATGMIVGKFSGTPENDQYVLYCSGGSLIFSTTSPSQGAFDAVSVPLNGLTDQDIQVAYSWQPIFDTGVLSIYVNGMKRGEQLTPRITLNAGSTPFGIGHGGFANVLFTMKSFSCENLSSGNNPLERVILDYIDNFS